MLCIPLTLLSLAQTLHSLLYIGGSVIPASAGHSEANVLVGLEL